MKDVRPMGNCSRCCYATRKRANESCICARFPKWVDVYDIDNHFCGEFVSHEDYRDFCHGRRDT